ncbi:MAG: biotin--[acetyl-CoA-carboxylase] ligase [Pseudanabaenaceae cyanobacterium bins.68]|nr:biotin--[acetyl-CoA-carboxylase] ligase [Pseudanabaenaceae cyanobacterium bins.68]
MWLYDLPSCDSTNTWALQHLTELHHGDVVFTPNQTQGRGQYGRSWHSGGFTASFVLEVRDLTAVSLQVGLLVCQGLVDLMPSLNSDLQLKWPNDLMLAGRKLGGILCEVRTISSQTKLVAGIGLNVSSCPVVGAACLTEFGSPPEPAALLERLRALLVLPWNHTAILANFGDRDFLHHKQIGVELGAETLWGKAMGISDRGELILMLANNQLKLFSSGHIHW